jgi:hypothetical protein
MSDGKVTYGVASCGKGVCGPANGTAGRSSARINGPAYAAAKLTRLMPTSQNRTAPWRNSSRLGGVDGKTASEICGPLRSRVCCCQ